LYQLGTEAIFCGQGGCGSDQCGFVPVVWDAGDLDTENNKQLREDILRFYLLEVLSLRPK
jgi:hypothetical protein